MKKIIMIIALVFMCSCAGWLGTVKEGVTTVREGYAVACELIDLYKVMKDGYIKAHGKVCDMFKSQEKKDKCIELMQKGLDITEMLESVSPDLFRTCPIN